MCRVNGAASTRAKGVVAPFQERLENERESCSSLQVVACVLVNGSASTRAKGVVAPVLV